MGEQTIMKQSELWKHIDDQVNKAGRLMQAGQWIGATNQLEKAIQSDHTHPSVHIFYNMLGSCYFNLRHFDKAEKAWNDALQAKPNFADARANIGHVFVARQQWREAFDSYLSVLQSNKNHRYAQSGMGMLLDILVRTKNIEPLANLSKDEQLSVRSVLNKENESKFLKLLATL